MARSTVKRRRIGPLDCIEVAGDPAAPTVVLFHGFGADMSDLASLADVIQAPKGTNWYFPNGHLTVPLGGHYEGRAWFPISIADLEKSMTAGQPIDLSKLVPPGMKKARENVLSFFEALKPNYQKLLIGGFSQGAMVATDVALRMKEKPTGLVLLSGTLVNADEWGQLATQMKGFKFFQAHGARDPVLSFDLAKKLEQLMKQSGWNGALQRFEGGHEIPPEVLIQLGAFCRKALS